MERHVKRRSRAGSGKARLEEVARLAEVSTATVSRVFNDPARVSDAIQTRVREAAAALNWVPNAAGRALASSRTHIAGAIIPTLDNEIFARQVTGLQSVLAGEGLTLLLGCSNYDPAESLVQVQAMLARGVEALAIVGEDHPPALFDALDAHRVPYVLTYSFRPDCKHPCIGFDNHAAFERLADHVLLLGHEHVAVILQPLADNSRVAARLDGIRDGLARRGLTLDPADLHVGPSTIDFGAEAFARLARARRHPTAVICGNDNLAIGAMLAASTLGVRIPDDCSITGFDDLAISSRLAPRLTTMWVDNLAIGHEAAKSLLRARAERTIPPSIEFEPVLRTRGTTGRLA